MAFTQQPINYAKDYARDLANAFPYLSYFSDIFNAGDTSRFKPVNGNGVWIPSIATSGARATNRDQITGTINRNFNVNWELKTMSMDREWDTLIDPMDMVETNEVATIANVTKTFNEFEKIPEMDAYCASKLASFAANFGGVDSTVLTSDNILAQWDAAIAYMTNQRVNRDRVKAYLTPDTYKLLKEAAGITRFIDAGTGIRNVDRNVGKLDGVTIIEVPADIMQSSFDFTTGWVVNDGASQINMLLVDPQSVVAPIVYETALMSAPTAQSKGKWLYYERYYYDVFALKNRQAGFFVNMTAPALGTVNVTSVAGSASKETIISYDGAEVGAYGIDAYIATGASAANLTYNDVLPSSASFTKITGQNPITLTNQTSGQYATVALVNKQTGKVVAGGNAVIVAGA